MKKRWDEITKLSIDLGYDFFPIIYETITQSVMDNICSYGLPIRYNHWSFGRTYDQQRMHGQMGYSKVYEVILNNNPSYAFMMDTNTDVQNLFIVAHCIGHSHFFKNNYMFADTDRNMVSRAAEHAGRIQEYVERYGVDKVEHIIDIAMSLERHIDWNKGVFRKPYPKKSIRIKQVKQYEFDDLTDRDKSYEPVKETINNKLPPRPEKDILYFLINYAPLEEWEKDVLEIIRGEAYYFHPQMLSKISNEGFAVYAHTELMREYNGLTSSEYLDFARDHEKVVQPGGNPFRMNPYYLGFRILKSIEKEKGRDEVFNVIKEENDISLIKNYLTPELVEEMNLFTFGYQEKYPKTHSGSKRIQIKSKMVDDIAERIVSPLYNGGVPKIVIDEVTPMGTLIMRHDSEEMGKLNIKYATKVVEYIWELWAAPVELCATNDDGEDIKIYCDEAGAGVEVLGQEFELKDDPMDRPTKKIWNI